MQTLSSFSRKTYRNHNIKVPVTFDWQFVISIGLKKAGGMKNVVYFVFLKWYPQNVLVHIPDR
jgi:hypothetical protein